MPRTAEARSIATRPYRSTRKPPVTRAIVIAVTNAA
jgi:hypothetical protein